MANQKFYFRFTTALILMGSLMVLVGRLFRPSQIDDTFDISSFAKVHAHELIWIWSYRFLVFGLFLQVMGLAAFKSIFRDNDNVTILYPGVIVCVLALFVSAISEGYYMHMGAWVGWKLTQISDSEKPLFIESLDITHQWVICLTRMGYMFFCLGLLPIGWTLLNQKVLKKITGIYALVLGASGIFLMMLYPKSTDIYIPIQYAIALFFILLAISMKPINDSAA